jgi:methionine-rich copper-binding protein CopC/protocatechuate 3,4-dioxygenase beta subunit
MKRSNGSSSKVRTRGRKPSARPSAEVRRRAAGFKLESLEERTLLSVSPQSLHTPPASNPPLGLGVVYTGLSMEAHGVGLNTTNPGQHDPTSPQPGQITMSQFETWSTGMKATWDQMFADVYAKNAGTQPSPGPGITPGTAPFPLQYQAYTAPGSNSIQDYYKQHQDNPQQELLGRYAPGLNDPGNQLQMLAQHPERTGLFQPPLNPTIINGFDGMNFLDSVNGYVPPDTDMAVGPQYVIETVNAQIQFYDKTTGQALLPNTPLNQFFKASSESPFDPVVTYDEIAGRFIVAAPTFSGNLLFAVSNDSNPFDGFHTYDLNVTENGNAPDYTKIGWNADEVVITFNMYGPSGFNNVQILSFAGSSIFSSSPPPTLTLGTDYFSNDRFNDDFTMAAASMHGATPGMPMYFVEENSYNNGSQMRVVSADNLLSNSPTYTDTVVNVDSYTYPPSAQQPGGSINTNDTRILNADWRDGLLVASQNVGLFSDSNAHARWYEFNVTGSPTLVQDGTISPGIDTSTYYPAVAIAPGDVIGLTYNESSPTEYPSVHDTGRTSADPLGLMETPALAVAGTATYSDFAFRWGDYSGISIDPVDGSIWSGAEYSTSALAGQPANWATFISHFSIAPTVISSDPAAGSIVTGTPPTTFSLTFSEPIDPTSITAGNFTVDGVPADSASISADDLTITYTFNTTPIVNQGLETMSLPAGSVKGLSDQQGNVAFSANFYFVTVQLQVTATSPPVGSILTPPVTDIVVQLNKDFDPYSLSASDFQVSQGSVVSAVPLTSSTIDLTLAGVTHDGTLTLSLPAGAILDTYGVGNLAFSGTYIVDIVSAPYPTPLQGKPPAGGLIYDPSVTGSVGFVGDTDTYTLPLAANQTISLVLSVDPSLIGTLTLLAPDGSTVATATGASAGQTVVLQTAPVATAGTYSLVVGGSGGTTGNYTMQAILNAAYTQQSDSIHTIGTAYDLTGAFSPLGTTPSASRAGALGQLQSGGNNVLWVGPHGQGWNDGSVNVTQISVFQFATQSLAGFNAIVVDADALDSGGLNILQGRAADIAAFVNAGGGLLTDCGGLFYNPDYSWVPNGSQLTWVDFGDDNVHITPTGAASPIMAGITNAGLSNWGTSSHQYFSATAGLSDLAENSINGSVILAGSIGMGHVVYQGEDATYHQDYNEGQARQLLLQEIHSLISPTPSNYYSFQLNAGQSSTVVVKGLKGGSATVELVDASGNLLALGAPGRGVDQAISNFVAPSTGTYYAVVSGAGNSYFDLVVTQGSDFGLHGSNFNSAQPLDGSSVVLGAIVKGGALYANEWENPLPLAGHQVDPNTGAFLTNFPINAGAVTNPFGENLAFDGTTLYYNDGPFFGDNRIYSVDPTTGAVGGSILPQEPFYLFGIAYLDGHLWGSDGFSLYEFDNSTGAVIKQFDNVTSGATGLAGDSDHNVLWAVSQGFPTGTIYEINPDTGAVIKSGPDTPNAAYEQDIAYVNGELQITQTIGFGQTSIVVYDADTLALKRVEPITSSTFLAGITGGPSGGSPDWYQFNVNAGDNLVLTTTTPGGDSASGLQFTNDLLPTLNLYDAAGNLVATATGNAADGRNDVIDWTALTSGSYRVQILGATKDSLGEYTIAIQGATGGQYPFNVVSTNPAAGSDINYQPSTMTVVVNNSIRMDSVSPGDLTIDGVSATGVSVVDSHTLSFSLPGLTDGLHSVAISGLVDIHGVTLTPDDFTFTTDTVPPHIVSASLADGSVFSPAPQTVTDVITFSEPMNTSVKFASAISLLGEFRGIYYAPSVDSWDPTGTILTITYDNLPSDAYQFNLYASGFQDLAGNTLVSGLTTNFAVLGGTSDMTGLTPVLPLGSLVYQGTANNVLTSGSDTNTYNLGIDPRQTLAVVVTPVTSSMTATVQLISPTGHIIGTATSPKPGLPAVLPGVQSTAGGHYQIVVSGDPGQYNVTATLNAYIDPAAYGGASNDSIASATPIDPFANRFIGHNDRTAVLGTITSASPSIGDVLTIQGPFGPVVLIGKNGAVKASFNSPAFSGLYLFDIALAPDNTFYVLGDLNQFTGEIIHMNLRGQTLGTIISPVTDSPGFLSPEGFGLDLRDGSFWLALANSGNVVHLDSSGNLMREYFVGSNPDDAAVGPDGAVYVTRVFNNEVDRLDPSTGSVSFFTSAPFPLNLTWDASGNLWVGALQGGAEEFNSSGGFIKSVDGTGVVAAEPTPLGNIWDTNIFSSTVNQFSATGSLLSQTGLPLFQPGVAVLGDVPGEQPLPPPNNPVYSFALNQGESATIVIQGLNNSSVGFTLYDENGDVLAFSHPGATNYTQGLNNFVAQADGTYYVQVSGDMGSKYNLVVTRGADFTTQQHSTLATAQDVTATQGSGDSQQGGALGYLLNPSGAQLQSTIEGTDFNGSNCGCLPPDTNAAVGGNYVAEAVNVQFRVYDKTNSSILLDEPLASLFGAASGGDPYVVYDDIAQRWYVSAFDSNDSGLFLAVSNDASPLDGFKTFDLTNVGGSPDYAKMGFNNDAIFISYNDFSSAGGGNAAIAAINKADALGGTLTYNVIHPEAQFRAMPPAQMHGDITGGTEWFASVNDGGGTTLRVTQVTDYFTSTPSFTYTEVPVTPFQPPSFNAVQPGGFITVFPNTTTTAVDFRNGKLVTAMASATAADGFSYAKAHWYEVDVSGGSPALVQEGVIDPGAGVTTQMPAAAIDDAGNIGINYIESSASEFLSMYVAGHAVGAPLGSAGTPVLAAPGLSTMAVSFRIGDYGSTVYDPSSGLFWAANEYMGANGSSDIWYTKIASFSVFAGVGTDYYSVNANAGDNLHFATSTPAGGPLEFVNNFYPELLLYDPNGNLVAIANGNASDGRNSVIDFTVPAGDAGKWVIEVTPSPSTSAPTQGEYGLLVTGATGALSPFTVTSTKPAAGALVQPPTHYIATFSQPILGSSLTAGELTINGVPAVQVTLVNAFTVDWTIAPGSIPHGERVPNTAVISADPSTGQRVQDVSGATLADFTSTFTTDDVAPTVVSSSVNNGDVFSPAPYNLTEVVTFSEPMDTTFTTASSFSLHGQFNNQFIAAAGFSWDSTGTILTINFANLPEDVYTLTLHAGGFQDVVGIPMASDYTVNFAVQLNGGNVPCAAFPTPLSPVPPLGDLIYTGSDSHNLVTATDVNCLTLGLNAGGTVTVVLTPTDPSQQLSVTVLDPSNTAIGSATAPAAGQPVTLETVPTATTGSYQFHINDAGGALGKYSIQVYLNSYLKQGTANLSIATATDISGSSYLLGPGNADRLGVGGGLPADVILNGDVFVASRYYGFYNSSPTIAAIELVNEQGQIARVIPVNEGLYYSLSGVELNPVNNMLYAAVTTSFNGGSVSGELLEFDPFTGNQVATIPLPDDPAENFYYYPYGFSIAADGTFWMTQPNAGNVIHVDSNGNLLASYATGTFAPESAVLASNGLVYFGALGGPSGSGLYTLDPSSGNVSFLTSQPLPQLTKVAATGGIWSTDWYNGSQRFDLSGNFLQGVGYYGSQQAQTDPAGNVWNSNFAYYDLFRFDPSGNQQLQVFTPGALGMSVWGVDNPNAPPQDTQDYYKFDLTTGQTATIAAKSLNGENVGITLVDGSGNVLATGVGGASNVNQYIQNFAATYTGTYYVEVTGDPGVKYSLTVTRGANFDLEPHGTITTAQPLTGTNGALGALDPGGNLTIGNSFEGIDFNTSNCGCLPPDTNASVGNNFVVETVNEQIRVFDKTSGSVLLDEKLADFFGQSQFGDPYVVYDDIANRWYVSAFDGGLTGLLLAVSNDGSPLDGFLPTYHLTNLASSAADYEKLGFNKDGIFLSFNNFNGGNGAATVASIDKAAALSGTLSYFVSTPPSFQFRGMPPAQMHGDTTGGVEWFMSAGNDTGGNTITVTKLQNYLSSSPVYTEYLLPVTPYMSAFVADQPGGGITTFPNTTFYETQYRNGHLLSAMSSALASSGGYGKGLYYQVDISSGTPTLMTQGVIDPGPGVSVQMPAVDEDIHGNLGFSWFESSSTEFMSMWVGSLDTHGHFSSFDAAPGGGFFFENFRIGDYGTVVLDPTDGTTFWGANEYIGSDGANDIWRTHITSFSVPPAVNNDWYSINLQAGVTSALYAQTYTPSDQGGQFINTAAPNIELYDTFGNLVATGSVLPDGRNQAIFYNAPVTGQYFIRVFNNPGNSGEYYLRVDATPYTSGDIAGQVYNDTTGAGINTGIGLNNWEVDVFDSGGNFVASQLTSGNGNYDIAGLAPGTYTVYEALQAGWTQTAPLPDFFWTVTVTAGTTASGNDFGNFQNITISGRKFNDLTGSGIDDPSDPGLPGWTIDLLNSAGALVASTVTDASGNYSFSDVGPGTYTVQEEPQPGWIQTFPAPPGTYTITTTSGQDVGSEDFGNFQLVTFSGQVYNDLNGDGSNDGTDPGLQGWTVNLLDPFGNLVATTTSDVNGNYSFANVGPGTYTVQEVNQNGWYQTQPVNPPGTYTVQAISSTNPGGLDFGNFQLINVTGQVYNDLNGDGSNDGGTDPGLQGWTVTLYDHAGNTVATTTSDANGNYEFDNLFPGTFTVAETLQAGWIQTQPTPIPPGTYTFTTQSGTNETGLDFGNFINSENLSGQVYNDLNGDGSNDGGTDPGLAGWTVNVHDLAGNLIATTTSDSNGNYSFTALPVHVYIITEVNQAGWTQTQPVNPNYYQTTATSGDHPGLDFGNFQQVTVSGNIYNDLNGNGQQNTGEPALKNWTVDVVDSHGNIVASATSDAHGNYTITGVGPGTFTLQEDVKTGWVITQPTNPTYYQFTTQSGTNKTGLAFGNFQLVTVSGSIYNDIDGNGQKTGNEPGLAGWTVNLEDSHGTILATETTDASGNYSFTNVGPGSYQVAQVVQPNWVQTQPLYPLVYSFTSISGGNLSALRFGDHASPALSPLQVIDNGQSGYSETGSWNTVVGGFNGTNRNSKTAQKTATATATWNFNGLAQGQYDVYVTFATKSGYSPAAPFTVYDGGFSLGTQSIDQHILVTQAQGGRAEGSYGGVGWVELGTYGTTTGNLQVVLANLASGNFVDADGVLIIAHTAPSHAPAPATAATSTAGVPVGTVDMKGINLINGTGGPKTVTLKGVSAPIDLSVSYNGTSTVNQGASTLVDSVIGLGINDSKSGSSDVIGSLAQDLLTGTKKKS